MNTYQVFGGVLRSELDFPELDEATRGEVDWALTVSFTAAPDLPLGAPLGEDKVDRGVEAQRVEQPLQRVEAALQVADRPGGHAR